MTINTESKINLPNLLDCLHCFYKNTLDEPNMSRLYTPLLFMYPYNTLKSQVDMDLMREALGSIPEKLSRILDYKFTNSPAAYEWLTNYYILHEENSLLDDLMHDWYYDALSSLSEALYKLL